MGLTAKDKSLIISSIEKGGQAEKGGVQEGDVITSVGGVDVKSIGDVKAVLAEFKNRVDACFGLYSFCFESKIFSLDFLSLFLYIMLKKQGDKEVVICCSNGAVYWARKREQNMEEVASLLASAENGDEVAQYKLGVAYSRGFLGLDQSDRDAVRWWEASVAQGYTDAQVSLGIAYFTGRIGGYSKHNDINYSKAMELWQEAANKGSCDAKTQLACMYLEGKGVTRSLKTAMKLLKQASSEGLGNIQVFCYSTFLSTFFSHSVLSIPPPHLNIYTHIRTHMLFYSTG